MKLINLFKNVKRHTGMFLLLSIAGVIDSAAIAGEQCYEVRTFNESETVHINDDLQACLQLTKSDFEIMDVTVISNIDILLLELSNSGEQAEEYKLQKGIKQIYLNNSHDITQFLFKTSKDKKPFSVDSAVSYENGYPSVTFSITENTRHQSVINEIKKLSEVTNPLKKITETRTSTQEKRANPSVFSNRATASVFSSNATTSECNSSNTSPVGPSGIGLRSNLNSNTLLTQSNAHLPLATRMVWFKSLVQNRGPWDFKQIERRFAPYGNFHYGSVGAALGIPENVLYRAAGWAQIRAESSQEDWGHYLGFAPYGDDPEDQAWIKKGINYYNEVFSKKSDLMHYSNADYCNQENNNNIPSIEDIDTGSGGGSGGGSGSGNGSSGNGSSLPIIIPVGGINSLHLGDCGSCHTGNITWVKGKN